MISRTVFSIKSPRKETCGNAALFRDFLSLADCIFVVIGPLLRWRDCLCSVSEYTSFETDRLLSRLECFAHWQSRQSTPDGAGSGHTIYITMEPCSRTVSPLQELSHRGATICVLSARRRFSPFPRHHLMQATVLFPTSSVLIGRPVRSSEHM